MRARVLHLHFQTYDKLRRLKKEAEADGARRVAKRIHAITLNHDGLSSGEIAGLLDAPRSKVSQWLSDYEQFGLEALLEGQRPGRPGQLTKQQQVQLEDIIDSGPQAWGFLSGVWSAPMVGRIMTEEFGVRYSARHVQRLLHQWGFSVQRPRRLLLRANPREQNRWRRYTYPRLKKNAAQKGKLVFEDEASFRQDSTLYRTWLRVGQQPLVPVTGARQSAKIFGCVEVYDATFVYGSDEVFNGRTYVDFLDGKMAPRFYQRGRNVIYIQDNASYHKEAAVQEWFAANRQWLEVQSLPPYSPEFNAAEPLWHHTRVQGTHNRCFKDRQEILDSLRRVFRDMQRHPESISGYLRPFQ